MFGFFEDLGVVLFVCDCCVMCIFEGANDVFLVCYGMVVFVGYVFWCFVVLCVGVFGM